MKNPISVYVIIDEYGKLVQRTYGHDIKSYPWIALSKENNELTMANPAAYKYDHDGTVTKLKECLMIVSTTVFSADGEEDFSVSIRGQEVDDGDEVLISINGSEYFVPKDDHIEVTASSPGAFVVKMIDDRYYCSTPEVIITAI